MIECIEQSNFVAT
jgi:hypothetical protein